MATLTCDRSAALAFFDIGGKHDVRDIAQATKLGFDVSAIE
jgi:hypothetical protein